MTALNVLYRDATAAAAAVVITFVMSLSFVQSTATAPAWQHTTVATSASLQSVDSRKDLAG
jgi:hypothetical protein